MNTQECKYARITNQYPEKSLDIHTRLDGNSLVNLGFDEETAIKEASRCLGNVLCENCDLCRLVCPDLCIFRNKKDGFIEINYDVCKGCGICAVMCPKGAIKMEPEGKS